MSRTRKTDKHRLLEERGSGTEVDYNSWFKVHEFASRGRVHRILGWKQNRVYQLMSDLELYYFLLTQWEDNVNDIREQFPLLPIETTIAISKELNIIHPPISRTEDKDKTVITTDFLLTLHTDIGIQRIVARTIKPDSQLQNNRVQEKFAIEKEYWRRKNVDWKVVTDKEMNLVRAKNLHFIYDSYFWNKDRGYSDAQLNQLIYQFKNTIIGNDFHIASSIEKIEKTMDWQYGEGLCFFKYLLLKKEIMTDFDVKFNFRNMKIWFK